MFIMDIDCFKEWKHHHMLCTSLTALLEIECQLIQTEHTSLWKSCICITLVTRWTAQGYCPDRGW
ncbi:hypothetical protein BDA96_01G485500 [Sorghum bicolor]|uniref:Uncharacterized protein n=2 Tax=Sorghum bicolor TaxID=4558 RepID=A0A921V280_SORBI|nr:hypothetical protein BDA96_01G485500 [Sorghum bicolor]OQU92998.1 hypothetical protein SORBI_3001G455433 [Sorghum bicolor]